MHCTKGRQLIHADLDGELDDSARAVLEAHTAECAECARLAAALGALVGGLETMEAVAEPADFTDEVMARIKVTRTRRRLEMALPWVGVGLGSALIYAGIAAFVVLAGPWLVGYLAANLPSLASGIRAIGQALGTLVEPYAGSAYYIYLPPALAILAANVALACVAVVVLRRRLLPSNEMTVAGPGGAGS